MGDSGPVNITFFVARIYYPMKAQRGVVPVTIGLSRLRRSEFYGRLGSETKTSLTFALFFQSTQQFGRRVKSHSRPD